MKKWYCVPHLKEVGSYTESGGITDFPRGVFLAYSNCCLVTGMKSEESARKAIDEYPCEKYAEKKS